MANQANNIPAPATATATEYDRFEVEVLEWLDKPERALPESMNTSKQNLPRFERMALIYSEKLGHSVEVPVHGTRAVWDNLNPDVVQVSKVLTGKKAGDTYVDAIPAFRSVPKGAF